MCGPMDIQAIGSFCGLFSACWIAGFYIHHFMARAG